MDYREEMRKIQKQLNIDELYFKKFGILKKSNVLLSYERVNEAFDEIAKAV